MRNVLDFVMVAGDVIGEDLMLAGQALRLQASLHRSAGGATPKHLNQARADFEKVYLIDLLEHCDGKAARAAEIAGKYRADFYDLLKKHGIKYKIIKSPSGSAIESAQEIAGKHGREVSLEYQLTPQLRFLPISKKGNEASDIAAQYSMLQFARSIAPQPFRHSLRTLL